MAALRIRASTARQHDGYFNETCSRQLFIWVHIQPFIDSLGIPFYVLHRYSTPAVGIEKLARDLAGLAELVCLELDGKRLTIEQRSRFRTRGPSDAEWSRGLTSMRRTMLAETHARIVLGGRVDKYKGVMPGIAEEALLSLKARQPLYLMGGFGGCARDVAETTGLVAPLNTLRSKWSRRRAFKAFSVGHLNNGLTPEENATLARTPHVDQAYDLNNESISPPRGRSWNASTINGNMQRGTGIIQNELYAGRLVWNK